MNPSEFTPRLYTLGQMRVHEEWSWASIYPEAHCCTTILVRHEGLSPTRQWVRVEAENMNFSVLDLGNVVAALQEADVVANRIVERLAASTNAQPAPAGQEVRS